MLRNKLVCFFIAVLVLCLSSVLWGQDVLSTIKVILGHFFVSTLALALNPLLKNIKPIRKSSYVLAKVFGLFFFAFIPWTLAFLFNVELSNLTFFITYFLILLIPIYFKFFKKENIFCVDSFISGETFSLLCFSIFLTISSFHPDLYGGEKPMDFSLLGHLNDVRFLPVEDPWAYGENLKYYYFSYFSFAALNKFIQLPVLLLYPFSLAISFSLLSGVLTAFFSGINVAWQRYLSTSLILFGGTFYGPYIYLFKESVLNRSFFWDQTRLFSNSYFAEFTSWTYFFSDLHPHVASLPYSLTFLYLIKTILSKKDYNIRLATITALLYGSLMVLNSWDFIIYSLLVAALYLIELFDNKKRRKVIIGNGLYICIIGFLSQLPSFFILSSGRGLKFGVNSTLHQVAAQFLFLGMIPLIFTLSVYFIYKENKKIERYNRNIFLIVGILLVLINIFYFMDPINTWFKFYTNFYCLLFISSLSTFFLTDFSKTVRAKVLFLSLSLVILYSGALNISSLLSYQIDKSLIPNLNGVRHLNKYSPGEYAIIKFIKSMPTRKEQKLISSYGTSFDYQTSRVSTFSHVPTYLGWIGHLEVRGMQPLEISKRVAIVDRIYQSIDALEVHQKLKEIKATLLFIGPIEIRKYKGKGLLKFDKYTDLFTPLISYKGSTLYRINY